MLLSVSNQLGIKLLKSNYPIVNYNKNVSDTWLRRLLNSVAQVVDGDLTVHSGDRDFVPKGGSKKSAHIKGRAADLKVSGYTPKQVFEKLRSSGEALPCPMMGRYQILYHGKHTETDAEHVHIGRYDFLDHKKSKRSGFDFWIEGQTLETKGKYELV